MTVNYLFVDMNSFFASVEQQLNPALRGRPVAVAPVDSDSTSCIAASYEAKRFGVKTGTRIYEAKLMCPGIVVIPARSKVYIEKHHQIVAAVDSVLPVTTVMSVDEMLCKLRADHMNADRAIRLAKQVKNAIYAQAGEYMRCSIGISTNKLLSKVAADMQKPDGLTVIHREELPERLFDLKLNDFPGIGPRMERRLNLSGIATVQQLFSLSEREISKIWGSRLLGGMWYHRLRGVDIPDTKTRRKSLGHSRVLEPSLRNPKDAREMLIRLVQKAAARLRHIGYMAGSVSLSISYEGKYRWKDGHRIEACRDTLTLMKYLLLLWDRRVDGVPKKIGLVFGELKKQENVTRSLFEPNDRLTKLADAMDEANGKFGRHAVYFGGMHGKAESVSTRIAFGTVPDTKLSDC